jgi:molybdopterin synthase sulfur carrier subunit
VNRVSHESSTQPRTVQVRYFASLRELLGSGERVELLPGARTTVGALRDLLVARGGRHAEALGRPRALRCALNQTLADEAAPILAPTGTGSDGGIPEVAFFPPVTGG